MLKTTISLQVFAFNKMLITNKVGVIKGNGELIQKSMELKTEKLLKSQKLSKSQKSAKLEKKLSKSENLLNFDPKKNKPNILTPKARIAFNRLWLAFTKAPIL